MSISGLTDPEDEVPVITDTSLFQDEAVSADGSGNAGQRARARQQPRCAPNERVAACLNYCGAVDRFGVSCSGEVTVYLAKNKFGPRIDDSPLYDFP